MGCCFNKELLLPPPPPPPKEEPERLYHLGRPYVTDEAVCLLPSIKSKRFKDPRTSNSNDPLSQHWGSTFLLPTLPRLHDLSAKQKQELADKWTSAGRSEHASIASFALFSQKLLCIGAPPDFVLESYDCAMEEVEHAKLSFALA